MRHYRFNHGVPVNKIYVVMSCLYRDRADAGSMGILYWAKVLPEQSALLQIFRKHKKFRKKIKNEFRTGYHSSVKITKFHSHKISLDNLIRKRFGGTHSKCLPSKVSAIDNQCIGFSKSLRFPLIRNGERVLMFLNVWSFRVDIYK